LAQQTKEGEMKEIGVILLALVLALVPGLPAVAGVTLHNSVICTGSGEPANASNSLWCTLGQPALGTMSNSTFTTETGFWYPPIGIWSGLEEVRPDVVARYWFGPGLPNPFKAATTIRFSVPKQSHVSVTLYDVTGRQVRTLLDEEVEPGHHRLALDGTGLASGVYFCQMVSGRFAETRKLVVLR
jgi:hypothetical protein